MIPQVTPSYAKIKNPSKIHKVLVICGDNRWDFGFCKGVFLGRGQCNTKYRTLGIKCSTTKLQPLPLRVSFYTAADYNPYFSFLILNLGFWKAMISRPKWKEQIKWPEVMMWCGLERASSGTRVCVGWKVTISHTSLKELTNHHLRFTKFLEQDYHIAYVHVRTHAYIHALYMHIFPHFLGEIFQPGGCQGLTFTSTFRNSSK